MGKLSWNAFTDRHPQAVCFIAKAPRSWPKGGMALDKVGKKIPAPYGLFSAFLKSVLTGDWTIDYEKGAAVGKLADAKDVQNLASALGAAPLSSRRPGCTQMLQISFTERQIGAVAKQLGYDV